MPRCLHMCWVTESFAFTSMNVHWTCIRQAHLHISGCSSWPLACCCTFALQSAQWSAKLNMWVSKRHIRFPVLRLQVPCGLTTLEQLPQFEQLVLLRPSWSHDRHRRSNSAASAATLPDARSTNNMVGGSGIEVRRAGRKEETNENRTV